MTIDERRESTTVRKARSFLHADFVQRACIFYSIYGHIVWKSYLRGWWKYPSLHHTTWIRYFLRSGAVYEKQLTHTARRPSEISRSIRNENPSRSPNSAIYGHDFNASTMGLLSVIAYADPGKCVSSMNACSHSLLYCEDSDLIYLSPGQFWMSYWKSSISLYIPSL